MISEEEIEVLYNACYGGWGIRDKAKELYKLRKTENSNNCIYCIINYI